MKYLEVTKPCSGAWKFFLVDVKNKIMEDPKRKAEIRDKDNNVVSDDQIKFTGRKRYTVYANMPDDYYDAKMQTSYRDEHEKGIRR